MTSISTPFINQTNVNNVRKQILRKQSSTPYFSTEQNGAGVLTDFDSFPYQRFYRGVPESDKPIVLEREAGWRPRHDNCYKLPPVNNPEVYPDHCFEVACSTTYPCYPKYLQKIADRDALNLVINKSCIQQYR